MTLVGKVADPHATCSLRRVQQKLTGYSMILGKDAVNHDVRKQQRMFTGQQSLHHLSLQSACGCDTSSKQPRGRSSTPGDSKTALAARRAGAPRDPQQGLTRSTSLDRLSDNPKNFLLSPQRVERKSRTAVLERSFTGCCGNYEHVSDDSWRENDV
jgi:hypothetical protein